MGLSDALPPSFIEGAVHTASGANPLAAPAAAAGAANATQEVCTLIPGMFGIGIQFLLCAISVLMVLLKYAFEFPKRPKKVFIMDFVQLMCGSSTVHMLNIVSSILINRINVGGAGAFVQDECNMYFITTLFDATIGVYIEYKIVRYLAIKRAAQNYLKKNRKSKFAPTHQELADATKLATNSLNSIAGNFLVGMSSISTTASAGPNLTPSAASATGLGPEGDPGLRPGSPNGSARDLEALETQRSFLRDQFTHDLDDASAADDDDDLLLDDGQPNPGFWPGPRAYDLRSLVARFNRWSSKRNNREFLLNLQTWLVIVSVVKFVSIILFTLLSYHINLVTSYVLEPFNSSHRMKLLFVMIISPLFLNVFQYYVTDSIIKIKIPVT